MPQTFLQMVNDEISLFARVFVPGGVNGLSKGNGFTTSDANANARYDSRTIAAASHQ